MRPVVVNMKCIIIVLCCCIWSCLGQYSESRSCEVARECVTDADESTCAAGEVWAPNTHIFNCCPSCTLDPPILPPDVIIGCQAPRNCLPDGTFAAVQCKGDLFIGRCFCSDKDGKRIFGQMWRDQANEMTCACSRRRADLEANGRRDVTLHCTASGDYETLQCDDGICWCAEPSTGQPTVAPVHEQDMTRLPCYSSVSLGESYLRRCESIAHATALIQKEQSEHGTLFLGTSTTICDYDGSYGSYQITSGAYYCTGRDGAILGAWQSPINQMDGMDCNCARDSVIYFPGRGLTVTETCQGNGNYQLDQKAGDKYYCVDTDGYPTTGFLDELTPNTCTNALNYA